MGIEPNAEELDLIINSQSTYNHRGCKVGNIVANLEPSEYKSKLIAYMNEPLQKVRHNAIAKAMNATLDLDITLAAVSYHRRRLCRCPEEFYRD